MIDNRHLKYFKWYCEYVPEISSFELFERLIILTDRYEKSAVYFSGDYNDKYSEYDIVAGFGASMEFVSFDSKNALYDFDFFVKNNSEWIFTQISYDVKNGIEKLLSENQNKLELPEISAFVPEFLVELKNGKLRISSNKESRFIDDFYSDITGVKLDEENVFVEKINLTQLVNKQEYLTTVNKIKRHIQLGDVYELNYCMAFCSEDVNISPVALALKLNAKSQVPFFAFYKYDDYVLVSASPERFLKKQNNLLISQPIKGTAKRGRDSEQDVFLKRQLANSEKDRAENVMIVDLVRNDLARVAERASVKVEELFGVYTFPQVHQMISTVLCEIKQDVSIFDIFKALFPPGSMTGAPKIKAMQLIELYEQTKRSWYSGTVGYITPGFDFDFNVVIRSVLYNTSIKKLSFEVGGAITIKSDAEQEYEECLLKAKAILETIN